MGKNELIYETVDEGLIIRIKINLKNGLIFKTQGSKGEEP